LGAVLVFTVYQFLILKNIYIINYLTLIIFVSNYLLGCSSFDHPQYLYPSEKEMQVNYLCRLPYYDATSPHQSWAKSTPDLLIVGHDRTIVYFNNDRSFLISKDSEVNLPPGKYKCNL